METNSIVHQKQGGAAKALLEASAHIPSLLLRLRDSLKTVPDISVEVKQHIDIVKAEIDRMLLEKNGLDKSKLKVSTITNDFFLEKKDSYPDYGYLQIAAPETTESIFQSKKVRFGLSYQGQNLTYLGHYHKAKELYIVLDNSTRTMKAMSWWTDTYPKWTERNYSFHGENENHAMSTQNTNNSGTLFFWSWTGDLVLDVKHSSKDVQNHLHTVNESKL